jgi:hypothetical protein
VLAAIPLVILGTVLFAVMGRNQEQAQHKDQEYLARMSEDAAKQNKERAQKSKEFFAESERSSQPPDIQARMALAEFLQVFLQKEAYLCSVRAEGDKKDILLVSSALMREGNRHFKIIELILDDNEFMEMVRHAGFRAIRFDNGDKAVNFMLVEEPKSGSINKKEKR